MQEESREERMEEIGRKGGSAAIAQPYVPVRETAASWTRDLVRWGPIWAGLLLALGIQIVLGAVGLAVALSSYSPTAANFAERVTGLVSIWSVVSALVALFIGGYIAGRMASVLGLRNGLVQGSVVWALSMTIGVILSALGVAGLLGAVNITPFIRGMTMTSPEQVELIRGAAASAWWFVVGAVLAWVAAAGGGIFGAAAHTESIEEK